MASKNTELKRIYGEPTYLYPTGDSNRYARRRKLAGVLKFYGSNRSRPFSCHEDNVAAAKRRKEVREIRQGGQ